MDQHKANHMILAINYLLHKMKIKDVYACSFWNNHIVTVKHLFSDCQVSSSFWEDIKSWINSKCTDVNTQWTLADIILGNEHLDNATLNQMLLRKYTLFDAN
jgi:hypothetical protein